MKYEMAFFLIIVYSPSVHPRFASVRDQRHTHQLNRSMEQQTPASRQKDQECEAPIEPYS